MNRACLMVGAAGGLVAAALLLGGCPGSLQNPERFDSGPGGTDSGGGGCDAEALMAESCGSNAACHDAMDPIGGLDFETPGVGGRVIDVDGMLCVSPYVSSADPQGASLILDKITASPSCGGRMPPAPDPMLTPEEIACISAWVDEITGGGGGTDAGTDAGGTDAGADAAADGGM